MNFFYVTLIVIPLGTTFAFPKGSHRSMKGGFQGGMSDNDMENISRAIRDAERQGGGGYGNMGGGNMGGGNMGGGNAGVGNAGAGNPAVGNTGQFTNGAGNNGLLVANIGGNTSGMGGNSPA
jgi:hypothetical protein